MIFLLQTSIESGFSIAMSDCQRVPTIYIRPIPEGLCKGICPPKYDQKYGTDVPSINIALESMAHLQMIFPARNLHIFHGFSIAFPLILEFQVWFQLIGLREKVQETPTFHGKINGFL